MSDTKNLVLIYLRLTLAKGMANIYSTFMVRQIKRNYKKRSNHLKEIAVSTETN